MMRPWRRRGRAIERRRATRPRRRASREPDRRDRAARRTSADLESDPERVRQGRRPGLHVSVAASGVARRRASARPSAPPGPAGPAARATRPNRAVALPHRHDRRSRIVGLVVAAIGRRAPLGGVDHGPRRSINAGGETLCVPSSSSRSSSLRSASRTSSYCWTRWQATPGMRLLGLAVLDDGGGHALSARQAVIRWLRRRHPRDAGHAPGLRARASSAMLLGRPRHPLALVGLLVTIGQSPTPGATTTATPRSSSRR